MKNLGLILLTVFAFNAFGAEVADKPFPPLLPPNVQVSDTVKAKLAEIKDLQEKLQEKRKEFIELLKKENPELVEKLEKRRHRPEGKNDKKGPEQK